MPVEYLVKLRLNIVRRTPRRTTDRIPYNKIVPAVLDHCSTDTSLQELYLIGSIIYGTGIRRTELLGLRWDQIDFDRCQLTVESGLQSRQVQFDSSLRSVFQLLQERNPNSEFVFDAAPRGLLARASHQLAAVRSALEAPKLHLHSFRLAYGQRLLAAGTSLAETYRSLGTSTEFHADPLGIAHKE